MGDAFYMNIPDVEAMSAALVRIEAELEAALKAHCHSAVFRLDDIAQLVQMTELVGVLAMISSIVGNATLRITAAGEGEDGSERGSDGGGHLVLPAGSDAPLATQPPRADPPDGTQPDG